MLLGVALQARDRSNKERSSRDRDREGPAAAYRAVHAALNEISECWVSSSEIKLIGPGNPIALDVLAVMARHPGRLATKCGADTLGSMAVERTYIYPPRVFTFAHETPMTTEDITREVIRLMNRGPGMLEPSTVTLQNGTVFRGVPFSIDLGTERTVVAHFIVDREAVPRVVRLDEIASIV